MQAPDLIAGVAALTVVALALRLRGIEEGLWRDEPVTFAETQGRSLRGVLDVVANGGEYNPPLPFVLAWLTSKAGDPTVSIRIPSVLLGTATVPIVFLLGLRTLGRAAALVAAGLIALSPFAIHYGIEARGYGALMCFSALSALVLVLAVETNRTRWWIAYGLAVAAVLYTHYTGVFVIGAQGAWALLMHRGRWRGLVLAYLGAALLYLPWLPHVHGDPNNLKLWGSLTGRSHWEAFLQWAAGSPELAPSALPGALALVLIAAGVVVGLVARAIGPGRDSPGLLIPLLALASPVGILLAGHNLFLFPRNLSASLPFAALLVGWAVTPRVRVGAAVAVGLVAVGMGIGAAKTLQPRFHRPDTRSAARFVDDRARPGDVVLHAGAGAEAFILNQLMGIAYDGAHRVVVAPDASAKDFKRAAPGERVFVLQMQTSDRVVPPSVPRWEQVSHERYDGFVPVSVAVYRRRP
jgi:hypothetical protein